MVNLQDLIGKTIVKIEYTYRGLCIIHTNTGEAFVLSGSYDGGQTAEVDIDSIDAWEFSEKDIYKTYK